MTVPERNYTNSEVRSMQQDAIQRVMEMQRIANERLQRSNAVLTSRQEEPPPQPQPAPRRQENPPQNRRQPTPPSHGRGDSRGSSPSPTHHAMPVKLEEPAPERSSVPAPAPSPFSSGALEGFIHRLGLETDQLILIGLLLLLINEGADTTLILAVFYLLI